MVCYFVPDVSEKVKLLEFKPLLAETAVIHSEYLISVLEQNELKEKIVGFCADNCNTNFRDVKTRRQIIVFQSKKKYWKRSDRDWMCSSHCAQLPLACCCRQSPRIRRKSGCQNLQAFHIYTVQLKQFCDLVEIEYQRISLQGNTKFLSLLPAIQRMLEMSEGLKSYFNSQEGCPPPIKNCF